jgi:endonuclease G
MKYLEDFMVDKIVDSVMQHLQYDGNLRRIFWGSINPRFTAMQLVSDNYFTQLQLDLQTLNRTGRLSDGTIPFESWLSKALRQMRVFPNVSELLEEAAEIVKLKSGSEVEIDSPKPPSLIQLEKVELEKTIHQDDMLSFTFLEKGYQTGMAVARIKVTRYDGTTLRSLPGGDPFIYLGTGWLLSESLLITNHHVINARSSGEADSTFNEFKLQAASTIAEFDYNINAQMGINVPISELLTFSRNLDYAILRIPAQNNRLPIRLLSEQILYNNNSSMVVNIIQHPGGYAKKIALRNNHIYDAPYPKIRYFTDTEAGSSGAPVLNDNWEAIGLHRAHSRVAGVSYMGKETAFINEGIQIEAIMQDLKKNSFELWMELNSKIELR